MASRRPPKRRPAARRPGARKSASRIKWDRVGRIALVLVLFAVAYSYLNPAIDLFKTHQATSEAKVEFHELLRENKRLHRAVQSADEPAVVERTARRQGLIAEGERPFVLHGLQNWGGRDQLRLLPPGGRPAGRPRGGLRPRRLLVAGASPARLARRPGAAGRGDRRRRPGHARQRGPRHLRPALRGRAARLRR